MLRRRHETLQEELLLEAHAKGGIAWQRGWLFGSRSGGAGD
jgi:hypothetical protein